MSSRPLLGLALVSAVMAGACEREARPFELLSTAPAGTNAEAQSELYAGAPGAPSEMVSPYQENAWGISEGKRLYAAYNCVGCHGNGGGAIGPALMDDEWRYGFAPANIYSAIVEGRPNGMPAWRNKLSDAQVWQLVAYVQSMSGQAPIDAASGRSDHMQAHPPEPVRPYQGRTLTGHK